MQRVSLTRLKAGSRIAKDLYSFDGKLLLAKGTVLDEVQLQSLRRQGIEEVYIFDAPTRITKSSMPFDAAYKESLVAVRSFMLEAKLNKKIEEKEVKQTVQDLLDQVFDEVDLFRQMRLMKEKDDYLFTHSVNVALLSILIARWLKLDEDIIKDVGTAGILHDMGKLFIPDEILQKQGKLTEEEFQKIKEHATAGYDYVSQLPWVSIPIANAVLMHHERLDGSGYPLGMKGDSIPLYARIVAVADVYDAITSNRAYRHKLSPYQAAEILWEESFGKLDPRVAKIFYDRSTCFFVGNKVLLSDGREGRVIYINPTLPTRPVVEVEGEYVDLAKRRNLTVVEVIDKE